MFLLDLKKILFLYYENEITWNIALVYVMLLEVNCLNSIIFKYEGIFLCLLEKYAFYDLSKTLNFCNAKYFSF